jgi:hypothetical protein
MARWLARVFLLVAAALLGWAGYLTLRPSGGGESPWGVERDRDVGEQPVGVRTLIFDLTNPAARSRRILGLAEG